MYYLSRDRKLQLRRFFGYVSLIAHISGQNGVHNTRDGHLTVHLVPGTIFSPLRKVPEVFVFHDVGIGRQLHGREARHGQPRQRNHLQKATGTCESVPGAGQDTIRYEERARQVSWKSNRKLSFDVDDRISNFRYIVSNVFSPPPLPSPCFFLLILNQR